MWGAGYARCRQKLTGGNIKKYLFSQTYFIDNMIAYLSSIEWLIIQWSLWALDALKGVYCMMISSQFNFVLYGENACCGCVVIIRSWKELLWRQHRNKIVFDSWVPLTAWWLPRAFVDASIDLNSRLPTLIEFTKVLGVMSHGVCSWKLSPVTFPVVPRNVSCCSAGLSWPVEITSCWKWQFVAYALTLT